MLRLATALCFLTTAAYANGYTIGDTFEDPLQIAQNALSNFSDAEQGNPAIEVDVSLDFSGQMTILVAQTGFADDSVNGERVQYVLSQQDDAWTLNYMQRQFLCWRGSNTVTWQTNLCP